MDQLLQRWGFWVHRCIMLNAQVAASVPMKLFTLRGGATRGMRFRGRECKPPTRLMKSYLEGKLNVRPSPELRKVVQGRIEDMTEIPDHPILDVLENVNEWSDGFSWREGLYADLQGFGRHFTHVVGNGEPETLWRLMPQLTRVVPDRSNFVRGFVYGRPPEEVTFTPDEVLWIRLFDPNDPWGGLGPLEAWLKTVDAAFAIQEFQDWLFKRGGAPDYVITSPVMPDEKQRRASREEWKRLFGKLKWRLTNLAFLGGRDVKLEKLGQTNRELEFSESANMLRDSIGQAFGVPKSLLTADDVNRANAREADEFHMRSTIWPLVCRVEAVLNERFLPRFGGELVLIHENPVPEDRAIKIEERQALIQTGATLNEVREMDDQEPRTEDWADLPFVMSGLSTADRIANPPEPMSPFGASPSTPSLRPAEGDSSEQSGDPVERGRLAVDVLKQFRAKEMTRDAAHAALVGLLGLDDQTSSLLLGPKPEPPAVQKVAPRLLPPREEISHAQIWMQMRAGQLGGYDRCAKQGDIPGLQPDLPIGPMANLSVEMRRFLAEQLTAIAQRVEELGIEAGFEFALDEQWIQSMAESIRPLLADTIFAGGDEGLRRVGDAAVGFDVRNPRIQEFVDNYVIRLASEINGTTNHMLSDLVGKELAQGGGVRDIAVAIRELDDRVSGFRAEMIARTESTRAFMEGQRATWAATGVVTGKRWLLAPNACQFCQALAAEFKDRVIPMDHAFYPLGHVLTGSEGGRLKLDYTEIHGPPLHPHDRCDLIPVVGDE